MYITRTANAGVLLELDGCKILLDGVCQEVVPYLATPDSVKQMLYKSCPDLVAVTHRHEDHCDLGFEQWFYSKTGKAVMEPETGEAHCQCSGVSITAVPSRHIGKQDCSHVSYIIEGSSCIWFMGDAAPTQWKNRTDLPKPDVLIAPYAYANTGASWSLVQSLSPKTVILVHLPLPEKDIYGLRQAVLQTVEQERNISVLIPNVGEILKLDI